MKLAQRIVVLGLVTWVPACNVEIASSTPEPGAPPTSQVDPSPTGPSIPTPPDVGTPPTNPPSTNPPSTSAAAGTIAAGGFHTCVRRLDGRVQCWGGNFNGALGLGDVAPRGNMPGQMGSALPFVSLGAGAKVVALDGADYSSCAIFDDQRLKCWGANHIGEGGHGDTNARGDEPGEMGDALGYTDVGTGRTVRAVTAGAAHACAILDNGRVKCWGQNDWGQLGQSNVALVLGDQPGEMGDALPYVDLGTGRTAKSIVSGTKFTCAILDDDGLKCWGTLTSSYDNATGAISAGPVGDALPYVDLGGKKPTSVAPGSFSICVALDDGTVRCGHPYRPGALKPVDLGTGVSVKSLGRYASGYLGAWRCAQLTDDRTKCWNTVNPEPMGDALPFVDWGTGRTARELVLGTRHVCAVLDDGGVKCFGDNQYGQLGDGTNAARTRPTVGAGDALPYVDLGP